MPGYVCALLPDDGLCSLLGDTALHYPRATFLQIQLFGILFFAATIPISALLAERGRKPLMMSVTVLIGLFGLVLAPMFAAGIAGATGMLALGLR